MSRTSRFAAIGTGAVVLCALSIAWRSLLADESKEVTEVSVYATSGEARRGPRFDSTTPDQQITVFKTGGGVPTYLVMVRTCGATLTEEKAHITAEEWDEVVRAVVAEKLLSWKPETAGPAPDYGLQGFSVKAKSENAQSWRGPPKNEGAITALQRSLGKLANAKMEKARPDFFPK
jgi:hypothetical protein